MINQTEPTAEGLHRYRATGGYLLWQGGEGEEQIPCTCNYTCHRGCDGRCACGACSLQFSLYADARLWSGPEPRRLTGAMRREYGRLFPSPRTFRAGTVRKRRRGEAKLPRSHSRFV